MAYDKPEKITEPMPSKHYEHDAQWINKMLNYCYDMRERLKVCEAYSKVFSDNFDTSIVEHKRFNVARKAANTRLRIYINKKFKIFNR